MKPWLKIILKELSGSINDKRRFVSHIECEVASFKPLGVGREAALVAERRHWDDSFSG